MSGGEGSHGITWWSVVYDDVVRPGWSLEDATRDVVQALFEQKL